MVKVIDLKIDPKLGRLIKIIGKECAKLKINAYLVGGPVRDLLLGKSNVDLDIVVDKDVKIILPRLSKMFSSKYTYHSQFKTAKFFLDNLYIDFATTREERYLSIGSLPRIKIGSSIEKDLFRRDFTINAMAIKINEQGLSDLIDPFKGLEDLKNEKIRVLHKKSFLDDPTRIIRGIRFVSRFNFSFEEYTFKLLKEAVSKKVFSKVSPVRIGNEMIKLLQEENPFRGLKILNQLCGLEFIHPDIKFDKNWDKFFLQVDKFSNDFNKKTLQKIKKWLIYFIFLTENLNKKNLEKICLNYELKKNERFSVIRASELKKIEIERLSNYKYSELVNILKPIYPESIIYFIIRIDSKPLKRKLFNFLIRFSKIRLYINGERLKKMGFSPGPIFNKILDTLFLAKLDRIVITEKDEEDFIKNNFLLSENDYRNIGDKIKD